MYTEKINPEETTEETNLSDALATIRQKWLNIVVKLNGKMRELSDLIDLQYEIYTRRQEAAEYHANLLNLIAKQSISYKKKYNECFKQYKEGSNVRYRSDKQIDQLIDGDLADTRYTIDLLQTHADYIRETVKTFDSMIFGIKQRIEIQNIINGGLA